jgi:hypothetical protein
MRWFKHFSDAHRNPDLEMLIDDWGYQWYGRWWVLIELMASQVWEGNLHFSLQTNRGTPISLERLARELRTHVRRLSDFLTYLAENNLIDREIWKTKNLVYCPKLKELAEEHVRASLKKLRNDATTKTALEVEVEGRSRKESTCVPREVVFPEELTRLSRWPETWTAWEAHRREIGKPLKPTGIEKQLKFLVKQPDPVAVRGAKRADGWLYASSWFLRNAS